MRLSHAGGACLFAFVVVLFTGGETLSSAWTLGVVEKNKWLVVLYPSEYYYYDYPSIIPCVLLTRYYVLCHGTSVSWLDRWDAREVITGADEKLADIGPGETSYFGHSQSRKLKNLEKENYYKVDEYEESFMILLGELEQPFDEDERTGIVPLLVVREWPPDFHVKALFMAYKKIDYTSRQAVHATRNLISPVPCYARLSRWTVACITDDERRDLCAEFTVDHRDQYGRTHTNTYVDAPESIILVQGAFFGFFNQEWDRFAWRCGNDTNPYFYGTPLLSINSIIPWIQENICSEAVVLLPLDLPSMENFSSGVNPHMRGTGSTFMSELYGTHECCNCGSVYTATQFLLLLAICFFLVRFSVHQLHLNK